MESREAQNCLLWSKGASGTVWWELATLTMTAMTKDKGTGPKKTLETMLQLPSARCWAGKGGALSTMGEKLSGYVHLLTAPNDL